MTRALLIAAVVCFTGLVSADRAYPPNFYPIEHRSTVEAFPVTSYDYTIIPSDQYAVAEYDTLTNLSWLLDYIPIPFTAVTIIASKALSVVKHLVPKVCMVVLGIALAVGFCAFTPYCTLIIEKPFSHKLRSLQESYPYLDYVENFVSEAYSKYRGMQD